MSLDRCAARRQIIATVGDMARAYPTADYCSAREAFGLLGKIKRITGNVMPTARQCWEYVGLHRSALVDEFEFRQLDQVVCTNHGEAAYVHRMTPWSRLHKG